MTVDTQHNWINLTELGRHMKKSNDKKHERGLRDLEKYVHCSTVRYAPSLLSCLVV